MRCSGNACSYCMDMMFCKDKHIIYGHAWLLSCAWILTCVYMEPSIHFVASLCALFICPVAAFNSQGPSWESLVNHHPLVVTYRDVPLAKNPSTGTAQQRLFLVLKVVLHAVVVILEVLRLSAKSRCSRCCRHISSDMCPQIVWFISFLSYCFGEFIPPRV